MFIQDVKKTALKLHKDESAPTTVEWVLLIIVALIIMAAIYMFVTWAIEELGTAASDVQGEAGTLKEAADKDYGTAGS